MMKNDSLKIIGNKLEEAHSILLFPHVNGDGDAFGSCAALCHVLRRMGKECFVLLEDRIPETFEFLMDGMASWDPNVIADPDVCMCVDCGETKRFPKRAEKFLSGKTTICLDHHELSEFLCDYNYVEADAAAAGELVYLLLVAMEQPLDRESAEDLFVAITKDTGNFQYSSTSARTHEIAKALYETGADLNAVSIRINENESLGKIRLLGKALNTLELSDAGRFAMVCVTQAMIEECGAREDETDGIVETLRGIAGVEISAVLKETQAGTVRVSMRAKAQANVASVCAKFDGGGHAKAAGCTWHGTIEEAKEAVRREACAELEKYARRNH